MTGLSYNIDIEIFALFLTVVLYVEIRIHYPQETRRNQVFHRMTLLVLFTELFDMASAFFNTPCYGEQLPRWLNLLVNSGYFMLGFVLSYMLHYYIQMTFVPEGGRTCFLKTNRWVLLLTELSYLPNALWGFYFSISPAGHYIHGPLYLLQHALSFWLVVCASLTLIVNYKVIKWERILSGFLFISIYFAALLLQSMVFPNIFLIMPAVSIMLVLAVFVLESPDYLALQRTLRELEHTQGELEAANRKLEGLAYLDLMTGLRNRTAYDLYLDELAAAVLEDTVLLMADLNGLKALNDTWGHQVGDDALIRTARVLGESFPPPCRCYRIGGDEFAVIAAGMDQAAFRACFRRFGETMEREGSAVTYPFSVAAGYRAVGTLTLTEARRQADEAMYRAKAARKNP